MSSLKSPKAKFRATILSLLVDKNPFRETNFFSIILNYPVLKIFYKNYELNSSLSISNPLNKGFFKYLSLNNLSFFSFFSND